MLKTGARLWVQTQDSSPEPCIQNSGPAPVGPDTEQRSGTYRHWTPQRQDTGPAPQTQDTGPALIGAGLWAGAKCVRCQSRVIFGGLTISPPNVGYCDLGTPAEPGGAQQSRSTAPPQIRNPRGAKTGVTYTLSQGLYRHSTPEVYYHPGRWTYIVKCVHW